VGPVLGSYAFFTTTADDVEALKRVQWVYLAIAIFVFLLAGVFFISNIPEVTDSDMAFQVAETHVGEGEKPLWKHYPLFHATLAQFTYTGAQGQYQVTLAIFTL
jgi:FHS family L-fucose permease-like MFS transporter